MSDLGGETASLVLHQVSRLLARLDPAQIRDLVAGRCRLAVVDATSATDTDTDTAHASHPEETPRLVVRAGSGGQEGQQDRWVQPVSEVRPASRGTAGTGGGIDPESVRATVMTMTSRDAAASYVAALGTVAILRHLAGELGVRLSSKDRRPDIIRKIVDGTLGVVLTARAIRGDTTE